MKRELEHLEELKRLNATIARLQVYDDNEFKAEEGPVQQNSELPAVVQASDQVNPVYQHPQPLTYVAPKSVRQDDKEELVKVLAEAISENRLPIPKPTIFSGDPVKFNNWKSSFQTLIERKNVPTAEKFSSFRNMLEEQLKRPLKVIF